MMSILNKFKKDRVGVGLDIGTHTLKVVKLKFTQDKAEICGFDLKPAQSDLSGILKEIKQDFGSEEVAIAVSGPSTVLRYVSFPKMTKQELDQALKFEAQKHIPFSIAETILDGSILKEALADNKMLILIAAVKKDLVAQRIKAILDAGLRVSVVDMDSLALVNLFNFNNILGDTNNKTVALLNIGATISNLTILEGGLPYLSRDIPIAGNNLTKKLMDVFSLDLKSAESLKINPDQERADKVARAIESIIPNMSAEVRTSFDYYESQSASSVAKIYLSGGSSKFNGLKDMLANLLGIEVELWDPLKNIVIDANIDKDKIRLASGQLNVALGLALR